jgi:hypothetical protein
LEVPTILALQLGAKTGVLPVLAGGFFIVISTKQLKKPLRFTTQSIWRINDFELNDIETYKELPENPSKSMAKMQKIARVC